MTKFKRAVALPLGQASRVGLIIFLISLAIAGCDRLTGSLPGSQGVVYLPPTPAVTATRMASTPTPENAQSSRPSPTPTCENSLVYLEDVTFPDGSATQTGEILDKRWKVQNNGSCNWDERYSLRLIAGPGLNSSEVQYLYPARSGATAEIQVILRAPDEAGVYRSAWQAFDPLEQPFGDPIFVEFVVEAPGEGSGE